MIDQRIFHEQLAYYRARAQEYDESTRETAELQWAFARARELLQLRDPCEQVLELACGTGTWTQVLIDIGQEITVIDAAPEMVAIAQQKLRNTRVHYRQADLFEWKPEREYHLVFFANWLSHVPPGTPGNSPIPQSESRWPLARQLRGRWRYHQQGPREW